MSWRAKRQLVALLVVLGIFGGAISLLAYRFVPNPSCTDNKKNQREVDVDCGGPCGPCELKHPKPVSVLWTRAVYVRENMYDVAAYIKNKNEIVGSPRFEYEFTLMDESGPVARKTGVTFLLPQEETLLIETNLETTRQPIRAEIRILGASWQVLGREVPRMVVEKRDYRVKEEGGRKQSVVEARILNNSSYDLRNAEVVVSVLDPQENVIGVTRALVEQIRGGEPKQVTAIWPGQFEGEAGKVDVKVRVNMFDPDIILRPQ